MKKRLTSLLLFTSSFLLLPFSFAFAYDIHSKALSPITEDAKPSGGEMEFVKNGKINFAVVLDREAGCLRDAVTELTNAFVRCFGAAPEIYDWRETDPRYVKPAAGKDARPPVGSFKYRFYLGDQPEIRKMQIDFRSLPKQGYRIATFSRGLVLVGFDSGLIPGYGREKYECLGGSAGTLNGVLDFCERFLDVRWYFPGPYGSLFPQQKDLVIKPVAYTDGPYFDRREEPYMIVMQSSSKSDIEKWTKYLGYPVKKHDSRFCRYLRLGGTMPPAGFHSPDPRALIRNFPDKTKLIFHTSPNGRHWCNPKNPEQCYFNVFDLKFADFLVDEVYKPYFQSKGKIDKGGLHPYVSKDYVSFGQCDNKLPAADWKDLPIVKELGLETMGDVYGRFQQYLAKRIGEEFPGTRLFVLAYYDQANPPQDPRWKLPENFDVMLCAGSLPRRAARPDQLKGTIQRFREWYEASGNHPISKIWLYTDYTNPFSVAMIPEFTGDVPKVLGKYMGRDGCFLNYGDSLMWHYFWCPYVSFRSQWNPGLDVDAAIDEMWVRMFGAESGAHLTKFHRLIKKGYLEHYLDGREVYPVELTNEAEKELNAAGACLAKDSVEYKRWQLVHDFWPKAFAQQRVRAAYKPPVYSAPELKGEAIKVDGVAEAAWDKAPVMPLADAADPTRKTKWPTRVKMRWNAKGLYLLAQGDWEALVKPEFDMWQNNDMMELFVMPGLGKEVMHQFAWDFTGRTYTWKQRYLPVIQPGDSNWKPPFETKTTYGGGNWTTEAFVPWSVFDVPVPKVGESWNINVARDKVDGSSAAYEPQDMISSAFTMGNHTRKEMYGTIKFE